MCKVTFFCRAWQYLFISKSWNLVNIIDKSVIIALAYFMSNNLIKSDSHNLLEKPLWV